MLYPLYEFYKQSTLNLYEVREHFLENFYYQNHSRREADNVLRNIVSSSKVESLINESLAKNAVPNYEDFLTTICSMLKFMFKSNDTQALATMDAAILWDIKVNSKLHLETPMELKQDIIRVFQKYQVYKEMSDKDFHASIAPITVDAEPVEPKRLPKLNTWSLSAFCKEFGKMKVGEFVNNDTGEKFHSCVFTNGYTRTYVNFSSKLGELTPEEIEERKEDLVIVQLPTGKYSLAKKGKSNYRDVDI